MIRKIKSEILDSLGITLLLLSSFYFYKFSYFAVPNFFFIVTEILKIFIFLILIVFFTMLLLRYDKRNILLFLLNTYISIFFLKLIFNVTGDISLHHFLKILYANIFNFEIDRIIPIYIKILSYLSPFVIIFTLLFLFRNKLKKIMKFFTLFGFFISILVAWDLYKVFDKHFLVEDNKLEYSKKNINKSRKVLWLFFDGLDPEYINLEVDEIKIFKNFNDLNDNGIFHSNMFPPSNWTLYSSPSQLMGVNIKKMIPKHDTLIFKTLENKTLPFNFQNTIFGKLNRFGLDVSLLSSVLEYCTAYIISNNWKYCEDVNSNFDKNSVFIESMKFYFSLMFKSRIYLNELGLVSIKSPDSLLKEKLKTNMQIINFQNNGLDKIYSIDFKNNFNVDHTNVINIDKIFKNLKNTNFMFAHIYNPHLLNESDVHIQNKLNYKIEVDPYILKYIYSDLFVGKLFNELKDYYNKDLLVIISSDHWNRDKDLSNIVRNSNGDYIGNSYFYAKILGDNENFKIENESSSLVITKLIEDFFFEKVNSNRDIFTLVKNNKIKINVLMNK